MSSVSKVYSSLTLLLLLQLKFYYPALAGDTMAVSLLNGEAGSDKRQVVMHIVHSKFQIPSEMSLAYITLLIKVLILLFEWP
jgi:hypothetical protein